MVSEHPVTAPRRWLRATFRHEAPVPVGSTGRWEIELAVVSALPAGASIRVTWPLGWTPPTTDKGPGRVTWRVNGRGLVLGELIRRRHLRLNLTGGNLLPGDSIVLTWGGEDGGATVQAWLTDETVGFDVRVDPKGEWAFALDDVAHVRLAPAAPASLHVVVPSGVEAGKPARLRIAVLDRFGNLCPSVAGEAHVDAVAAGDGRAGAASSHDRQERVAIRNGRGEHTMVFATAGIHRVAVHLPSLSLSGRSNPCRAGAGPAGPWWGDPHVHTRLSDGAGSREFALTYARDVSLLDFTALTDHDIEWHHAWFAAPAQRTSDEQWASTGDVIRRYREPGRFAVLRGYEWTGRPWGDKCVYFRSDAARIRRYEPGDAPTPAALFAALREAGPGRALAVPHTPASNFMGTEWSEHDPDVQRLAEVYSMHGGSEFSGCPNEMINTVAGRHVRDALALGYRLGLIAAGDTHSSQPGNPLLGFGPYRTLKHKAGLTAVFAPAVGEEPIFDALVARRAYATSGARILLAFAVNGAPMGEELPWSGGPVAIRASVHGTAPVAAVEIIRDGGVAFAMRPGKEDVEVSWSDPSGAAGYYYLRVVQEDGEMAWSSPVWLTRPDR